MGLVNDQLDILDFLIYELRFCKKKPVRKFSRAFFLTKYPSAVDPSAVSLKIKNTPIFVEIFILKYFYTFQITVEKSASAEILVDCWEFTVDKVVVCSNGRTVDFTVNNKKQINTPPGAH